MNEIRADFDRLAGCESEDWNHNRQYHTYLPRQVPSSCQDALDIDCGTGCFTRALAQHSPATCAI